MKSVKAFWLTIFLSITGAIMAQTSNFTLVNAVNNNEVSLNSFSSKKVVVIVFTSNYCPYSKLYESRLKELNDEYSDKGVQLLLINPNDPESSKHDSIEEMAARARKNNYSFPYLADKDQKVSNQFGAGKTPEVYVLKSLGGKFSVVYSGAIDDNPQIESDVSRYYLKEAIDAVLVGNKPATSRVNPTGCIIKKN